MTSARVWLRTSQSLPRGLACIWRDVSCMRGQGKKRGRGGSRGQRTAQRSRGGVCMFLLLFLLFLHTRVLNMQSYKIMQSHACALGCQRREAKQRHLFGFVVTKRGRVPHRLAPPPPSSLAPPNTNGFFHPPFSPPSQPSWCCHVSGSFVLFVVRTQGGGGGWGGRPCPQIST